MPRRRRSPIRAKRLRTARSAAPAPRFSTFPIQESSLDSHDANLPSPWTEQPPDIVWIGGDDRVGEQRAIRWTDVDFELARVYVRRSAPTGFDTIKAPKSNRQRWVDLTPELAAALRAIRHRAELIFCRDDGTMMRSGQFHEVLWAAQRRAGLRRITWHDLRHSYASILVSGGMPLFLIRGLLGHSSVKMTERYAHLAASQTASYMPLLSAAARSTPATSATPPAPSAGPQAGPNPVDSPN